ncbi:MAG: class III poly(R)-hydroxyalkanoic acid synthase subunit PhaC [Bacteroidota bacterium]
MADAPFPPFAPTRELYTLTQQWMQGLDALGALTPDDIEIGPSPREAVYAEDKLTLYRYPLPEEVTPAAGSPLLIVYALVNRPDMVDLQEDRSLVRNLLNQGIEVYLIDWGYPSRIDRHLTLDDYINGYIDACVDVVRERHGLDAINLLGICQGGVFSTCYAALHPEKVRTLTTMVAPIDFHVEATAETGLLNAWMRDTDIDLMVDAMGNMPGDFMNFGYLMLKPYALSVQKYVEMVDVMGDERKLLNFLRMEKWIFDSPDQAGEAFRQFNQQFYIDNKLIKGEVEIGDDTVDLQDVTMPVLNIYAEKDHLVPPTSSQALGAHVGTQDYTVQSYPVGHIGMYVSGKVQRSLAPAIAEWLAERA